LSFNKLGANDKESLLKLVNSFLTAEDNQMILQSINDYLKAEIVSYYHIDEANNLRLLANIGYTSSNENQVLNEKWLDLKKPELFENEIAIFEDRKKEQELQPIFSEFTNQSTVILLPLVFKRHLCGIMLFGYSQPIQLTNQQKQIIGIIRNLMNPNLIAGNIINNLQEKITFYQKIMKDIRHDFANDLQSLALAIELLNTTQLNEEQQKYLGVLTKAKDKAVERIMELKKLKNKEEEVNSLGLLLAEKEKQ
jgi:Rps23 Pro-64 3,4-dihydroxylase Tpa1-like proline 4-hydroxylase